MLRRIVIGLWSLGLPLATWGIVPPPPAAAEEPGPPAAGAPAEAQPTLPQPAGRIGRLRRDEAGRIVPAGPPLPPEEPPPHWLFSPHDGREGAQLMQPPPVPTITSFDPRILDVVRSRTEHEARARRIQAELDAVIREEAEAKTRGAAIGRDGRTAREDTVIRELERIDREVREHEMQHYDAGQPYVGIPEYFRVIGPNGRPYAVSGITPMDANEIPGDREATIRKLEVLVRAALAPREPSEEDRRVAEALEQLIGILRGPTAGPGP